MIQPAFGAVVVTGRRMTSQAAITACPGADHPLPAKEQAEEAGLPDQDYRLFDSRLLVRMLIDKDDRFLGGEVIEDAAEIVQANYWRDAAWHCAIRRDGFAGGQHVEGGERPRDT